mmetsp:Transcript_70940/g.171341  ORF Transcript_70940/g.171341 Transcript_70940/m.171341 type:complete len:472 (+) Transcript_70940:87-1502(+)
MAVPGLPVIGQALKGGSAVKGPPSSVRDLGLAFLKIFLYMFLGVLLYTFPEVNERDPDADPDWAWDVVDCIYFTMVTITTVGYGDMPLLSQEMRIVTAIFGIFGVVQIAGSLNVIADWFVERARQRFMKKQRGLLKEAQRAGDLVRAEQAAEDAAGSRADGAAPGFAPPAAGDAADVFAGGLKDAPSAPPSPPSPHRPPPGTPGSEGPAPDTPAASKVSQVVPVTVRSTADQNDQIAQLIRNESDRISDAASTESAAPPAGAALFAGKPRLRYAYDLLMAALPCLFFIVCCFVLGVIENVSYDCYNTDIFPTHADLVAASNCWTGIDSFYYSIITLSTIGYGDVTPHSVWGQLIATFLIPFAIIALTNFMGKMHDLKMSKKMGADKTLLERLSELEAVIEADDDGIVSPEEYVIFNLKQMGKVDEDTVGLLRDQFKALDADGSGELDANDLVLLTRACEMIGGPSKPKSQR